jgi:hypothetical protein
MKRLISQNRYFLYRLLVVGILLSKCDLPDSNRSYVFQPNCETGQFWIKYDTLNPFEPKVDTLEILKIKNRYAWIKYNNKYEFSKECDEIERFWQYYK